MVHYLPTVNATLNGIAFVLLLYGYRQIRARRIARHRRAMVASFCVSAVFLVSYVTYHVLGEERRYMGQGVWRTAYFFILITHVVLAATVPVLASWTLILAVRGRFEKHRRLARITLPIWIYVSVTGVVVYLFLLGSEPAGHVDGRDSFPPDRGLCYDSGRIPEGSRGAEPSATVPWGETH